MLTTEKKKDYLFKLQFPVHPLGGAVGALVGTTVEIIVGAVVEAIGGEVVDGKVTPSQDICNCLTMAFIKGYLKYANK